MSKETPEGNSQQENRETEESWRPMFSVEDKEGSRYFFLTDAVEMSGLSKDRLRHLISANRVEAQKPGGRDLLVSETSLVAYLDHGRKKSGRPPSKK